MESTENEKTYQYKQCLNEILLGTESIEMSKLLKLEHVFEFIQKNIKNIGKTIQITDILPILEYSIRLECRNGTCIKQLDNCILDLFKAADMENQSYDCSLQMLYQILKTLSPEQSKLLAIGDEVFHVLMQYLMTENIKPLVKANILCCFRLYVRKFNAPHILAALWRKIERNITADNQATLQVLITLFDDFAECADIKNFKKTMQTTSLMEDLLNSEEHDKRKCAYYLLKKSFPFISKTPQFWATAISIFENLEENQSHLILPSLELLKKLKPTSNQELKWLQILQRRVLKHNNILVRRWVLEYFLEQQTFNELPEETATQFMHSLNETNLYNIEGYMLPKQNIKNFLVKFNSTFFEILSQLNWKAVPLHFWLSQLLEILPSLELNDLFASQQKADEVLLNLAAKIRALQNVKLRRHIIKLYRQLFALSLSHMDLLTFSELIKSLYNVSDTFMDFELLCSKFEKFTSIALKSKGHYIFDQRFYEILTNHPELPTFLNSFADMVYQKLEDLDCVFHGYLSLLVIFDFELSSEKCSFCQRNYDLDMLSLSEVKNFANLYGLVCGKIGNAVENKILLRRKCMDFYVSNFKTFNELQNCDIKLDEILNAGSSATLLHLMTLLAAHKEIVEQTVLESLLNGLREHLRNKFICLKVVAEFLKYFKNCLIPEKCLFWTKKLLELDLDNVNIVSTILSDQNIKINDAEFLLIGALKGDAKTGDSRIEEAYITKYILETSHSYRLRNDYVKHITLLDSMTLKKLILRQVCEMAQALNLKKPRYFAHSREHRMLTRMAFLLWSLRTIQMDCKASKELFQKLWSLLMDHNNQPNVTIIYECLIASITNFTTLMDKIRALQKTETKCSSSQEVSMIMLLYRYFERHNEVTTLNDYNEAISYLWPLTMGSSFQTRLYSQLVVIELIEKLEEKIKVQQQTPTLEIQTFIQLKTAIEQMIGKMQIKEFLKDFRFTPISLENFYDEIMFLTQMPYDEYQKTLHHFHNEQNLPKKKLIETAKGEIVLEAQKNVCSNPINSSITTDIQRKLNPTADFMPQSNLISYPAYRDHELYVIASFIDKIPNLGGIARTCEVLGIGNLVMASKADLTKADFKNLSMTAEKTLNIIEVKPMHLQEFLIQKKSEGFSIIGAEQTANSCNFVDFKFPKRSLLLLGHEKEGIPPNFLGFLDYAVEIPQFGMVRSLNVHVTGALFMWEYCKQHIYKAKKV